jgi:predicted PhzF superfamily epimerase YddE/YHI9
VVLDVDVVRVFTDEAGGFGNPLGVVLDSTGLTDTDRQAVAAELGYSETVFFDDVDSALLRLFTPACELPFAGHPLVGVSWLLHRVTGRQPDVLRPALLTEPVATFVDDGATWIRGAVADTPPWEQVQLADAGRIDALVPPERGMKWQKTQVWAWMDEPGGIVRARVFALDYDVVEDEACGSATLKLAGVLGRTILVHHGQGSLVRGRAAGAGQAEVGGLVAYDTRRTVTVSG